MHQPDAGAMTKIEHPEHSRKVGLNFEVQSAQSLRRLCSRYPLN